MAAKMIRAHTTAATDIPAFAPVERPLVDEDVGVVEAVGWETGCVAVLEG